LNPRQGGLEGVLGGKHGGTDREEHLHADPPDPRGLGQGDVMSVTKPLEKERLPEVFYIFKHSTTCPTSARAAKEVAGAKTALPVFQVNVREQRDLSSWVAETYGIEHESPQLLLIRGGKVEKVWNHYEINRDEMKD
jgi:bacillithiol system protein YtxJ